MADGKNTLSSMCLEHDKLRNYFFRGLGALTSADKRHIEVPNTSLIKGSVALDNAAKGDMPDNFRWDYAFDYNGEVYFVEVHPASTSEISTMVNKVDGLRQWLKMINAGLMSLPPIERKFYWVSSGKTQLRITPNSRQAKQLAAKKIVPVGNVWNYSKIV